MRQQIFEIMTNLPWAGFKSKLKSHPPNIDGRCLFLQATALNGINNFVTINWRVVDGEWLQAQREGRAGRQSAINGFGVFAGKLDFNPQAMLR